MFHVIGMTPSVTVLHLLQVTPSSSPALSLVTLLSLHSATGQPNCRYFKALQVSEQMDIFSPGYPNNYPSNSDCSWTITAPIGNRVTILCSVVQLPPEVNNGCPQDSLILNDLPYCNAKPIYASTGKGELVVKLKTKTNTGKFHCTVSTESDACKCGKKNTVSEESGQS